MVYFHDILFNYAVDFEVINIEEEEFIFWVFVFIMYKRNWRELYKMDTPGIYKKIEILEKRVYHQMPIIH